MKKIKTVIILLVALMIFPVFMSLIYADTDIKAVAATIANYTFKYKGKEVSLVSKTNKKALQPLNYNNELYVPIRSMADLLNISVKHDDANRVVEIGQRDGRGDTLLDLPETSSNDIKYFLKTIDIDTLTINKESFDFGLALLKPRKNSSYSRTFTLGKQYERLNFSSLISGVTKKENVEIKFIDVDRKIVLSIIDVSMDKTIQEYSVKVLGVDKLQITIETGDREITKYIMGNIYLK